MGSPYTQSHRAVRKQDAQRPCARYDACLTWSPRVLVAIHRLRRVLILVLMLGLGYEVYKTYTQPRLFDGLKRIQTNYSISNRYKLTAAYDYRDSELAMRISQLRSNETESLQEEVLALEGTTKIVQSMTLVANLADFAFLPVISPLRSRIAIIFSTTAICLLGGIAMSFLFDGKDKRLRIIQKIEETMGLPLLGIIPLVSRVSCEQPAAMSPTQRNVQILNQPQSQFADAFHSLRTSLLSVTVRRPPKLILFTSAMPEEGKTTAVVNLACVLAQGGANVLLLDADLRRPAIHLRFDLSGERGLTTVLAGASTFEQAMHPVAEVPNLDVLPSGPIPPFPAELLSSEPMNSLLEGLGRRYSYVIIDSPPILSVPDGMVISRMVDTVVLVIRHSKSGQSAMRQSRDLIIRSGMTIAGILLNAIEK